MICNLLSKNPVQTKGSGRALSVTYHPSAKKRKSVTNNSTTLNTMGLAFHSSSYLPLCKIYLSFRQVIRTTHRLVDGISGHPINALLIPMPKPFNTQLPSPLHQVIDSVQTHIQVLERRTEGEPDKVVARRVEEVSTVRGVNVEEDSRDYDRLFLEELFEEGLVCEETRVGY